MDEALNTRLDDARALYEIGVFGDGAQTPTAMSHEVLLAVSPEGRPGLFGERWWSGRVVSRKSTHDRDEVDVQVIEDGQPSITDAPPDGEFLCCTQSMPRTSLRPFSLTEKTIWTSQSPEVVDASSQHASGTLEMAVGGRRALQRPTSSLNRRSSLTSNSAPAKAFQLRARQDSNLRPLAPEASALSTELRAQTPSTDDIPESGA
jgi:hypothetical protein